MGYTTSAVHGIQVPDSSEANNIPEDIGKVVTALEGGSIVRRLSQAQINALTAPQKPTGLVVVNTTTGTMQKYNGSAWLDLVELPAAGGGSTSYTPTLTQGSTVTWNAGASSAAYWRIGKLTIGYLTLAVTGAGTAGQAITVSLPVTAKAGNTGGGSFIHLDVPTTNYAGTVAIASTTTMSFQRTGDAYSHGVNAGTLSNGDTLLASFTYEAA